MIFYRKYMETHRSLFFYQNKGFLPGEMSFCHAMNIRRRIVGFSDISSGPRVSLPTLVIGVLKQYRVCSSFRDFMFFKLCCKIITY